MAAKLIIERLRDWSYGAFLNETDASCIAVGFTEEEARENGERELKRREQPPGNPRYDGNTIASMWDD